MDNNHMINGENKPPVMHPPDGHVTSPVRMREGRKRQETWGGRLDFFLTCVGFAVGLGNIWRFPYICYKNGGGSFLVPYAVVLVCAAVPVLFLEVALGQYMGRGGLAAWDICPIVRGVGYACGIMVWFSNVYYIVILAWTLLYMYFSLSTTLPWATCGNWWNTDSCRVDVPKEQSLVDECTNCTVNGTAWELQTNLSTTTPAAITYSDSAAEFFERRILQISAGIESPGGMHWELVFTLAICWTLVYFCVWKGIKVAGKVVYFTALFPYVVLTILLIRGITLPGSLNGLVFYLKPDFSTLLRPQVWIEACTQVFYSIGVGQNVLIALGSYNEFNKNCYKNSIAITLVNSLSSIFAGFAVFSVLGFMAQQQGKAVADVVTSGPGLVFVVYPKAIVHMPLAPFWAVLFFFMLMLMGFDTVFAGGEAIMRMVKDAWPCAYRRHGTELLYLAYVIPCYLLGLTMVTRGGMYVFQIFDYYTCSGMALMWACMFEVIAIAWIYGVDRFYDNITMMIGYRIDPWLRLCWRYVTPTLSIVLFVWYCSTFTILQYGQEYTYPVWAQTLGMCLALSSMLCLPIYATVKVISSPGSTFFQKCRYAALPVLPPDLIPGHWPDREKLRAHYHATMATREDSACCCYGNQQHNEVVLAQYNEELKDLKPAREEHV